MNYILKYSGVDSPDGSKVHNILKEHKAEVIDDSMFPRMVLIKTTEANANSIQESLDSNWKLFPEKSYKVPDTRKRIKK